jgi:hypothetical protein
VLIIKIVENSKPVENLFDRKIGRFGILGRMVVSQYPALPLFHSSIQRNF